MRATNKRDKNSFPTKLLKQFLQFKDKPFVLFDFSSLISFSEYIRTKNISNKQVVQGQEEMIAKGNIFTI